MIQNTVRATPKKVFRYLLGIIQRVKIINKVFVFSLNIFSVFEFRLNKF